MKRFLSLAVAALVVASLGAAAGAKPLRARPAGKRLPAITKTARDDLSAALAEGRISPAKYALERAKALFQLGEVRAQYGDVDRADPRAATLILRDLALRSTELSGTDADEAEAILARPEDGPTGSVVGTGWSSSATEAPEVCTAHLCVHYVTNTGDQASQTWASTVATTFEEVWAKEIDAMGFRAPPGDGNQGENAKVDIYLENLEGDYLYGYCGVEDVSVPPWSHPAYCGVDNDYATFSGALTPTEILQVTAAHEFFHAIQFGYDVAEDSWMNESSATWMEEQVYSPVDDNRQYIDNSMTKPQVPADSFGGVGGAPDTFQYGQWIWWQYLSQAFGRGIVKEIWDRLDAAGSAPDDYSIQGMTNVLATKGAGNDFLSRFADFGAVNAKPSAFYTEGSQAPTFYKNAPREKTHTLGAAVTGSVTNADHLTNRYISFRPQDGTAATEKLTVSVNMSNTANGSRATLVAFPTGGGAATFTPMTLSADGAGQQTIDDFGSMTEVVLVLTNASNRFTGCNKLAQERNTCGSPQDDNQAFAYSGTLGATAVDPGEPGSGGGGGGAPVFSNMRAKPGTFKAGSEKTKVSFSVNEGLAQLKAIIAKKSGQKLAVLLLSGVDSAGSYCCITWNGRDAQGRKVDPGRYVIKLVGTDSDGLVGKAQVTVTVT